jgi:hypothetical protein
MAMSANSHGLDQFEEGNAATELACRLPEAVLVQETSGNRPILIVAPMTVVSARRLPRLPAWPAGPRTGVGPRDRPPEKSGRRLPWTRSTTTSLPCSAPDIATNHSLFARRFVGIHCYRQLSIVPGHKANCGRAAPLPAVGLPFLRADRRQRPAERAPQLVPRFNPAPLRCNLPHQPMKPYGIGCDRWIALVQGQAR